MLASSLRYADPNASNLPDRQKSSYGKWRLACNWPPEMHSASRSLQLSLPPYLTTDLSE